MERGNFPQHFNGLLANEYFSIFALPIKPNEMKELEKKLGHTPTEQEIREEITLLRNRSKEMREKAAETAARLEELLKEARKIKNKE